MKLFFLSAIFICTGFFVMNDSKVFEKNAQFLVTPANLTTSSTDTVPEKPTDPMQQLFDAVDKMERKLEGMGKQPSKDSISLSQQQNAVENTEVDTLMHRDTL